MKKIISTIITLFVAVAATAAPISEQQARQIATAFFSGGTRAGAVDVELAWSGSNLQKGATQHSMQSSWSDNLLYIYNRSDNPGFVIIAGDDCVQPIIAFADDRAFLNVFAGHSAAKTVHHSFVGGLLEHTLSVTKLCDYQAKTYPAINRDLLITVAMLHDIGKTRELSDFPVNEYTDEGQLLGHILIGAEMVHDHIAKIPDFPEKLETEIKHCILAHHGEYEYGSPKKPAIIEALALNPADNMDAKLQTMTEILESGPAGEEWLGFNRFFDSNIRRTGE